MRARQGEAATRVGQGTRLVSPTLVGRGGELRALVSAVSGTPTVVTVEGEAGVGKTRLVTELLARPELGDRQRLVGGCQRIRESFPLGPLLEAVRESGAQFASATLARVAGALRPLLPDLAHLLPPAPDPLDDRVAERHRVFRAMVEVLESLGDAVVVLEDVHWADEQSLDFVDYVLSRPPPRLALVLTYRGEEADRRVPALTARLPDAVHCAHIGLRVLDERQTGALAAAILGVDRVSDEFARYLCERSSGLPFVVEELLALLQARGRLVRRDSGWARTVIDAAGVPSGVRDSTLERVSRLSADARAVVEAAAVLQLPVNMSVMVATCRVPESRTLRGLEEALESGLLTERGDTIEFRHVLAAQATYQAVPLPVRRDLHGRAAAALGEVSPISLGQLAHHLRHAGRLAEWAAAAERAAEQAAMLGHHVEAVRLLADTLRYAPLETQQRGRLAAKLGRAAVETLDVRAAIDLLSTVLDQQPPGVVRGEVRVWLASCIGQAGDVAGMYPLLTAAVEELDGRPDLQSRALALLAFTPTPGVTVTQRESWVNRSLEVLTRVDDPIHEVYLLGKAAGVSVMIGDPRWRELAERILEHTGRSPQQRREANAYYTTGIESCYAAHHDCAELFLTKGLAAKATSENRRSELQFRSAKALLDFRCGRWEGLRSEVDGQLEELEDFPLSRIDVELVAGCLAVSRGDVEEGLRRLDDVRRRAEDLGQIQVLAFAAGAAARVRLLRGGTTEVLETTRPCLDVLRNMGIWAPAGPVLPWTVAALVATQHRGDARLLVDRCVRELHDRDAPLAREALEHSRGVLAATEGNHRDSAEHFARAARRYEELRCPYEAAQVNEQAAQVLVDAGEEAAEAPLRAALAGYARLGATWDLARVARTARRTGIPVPGRHRGGRRGYGAELSPRERQVAELAARGSTTKQIAQELYLSPNTVSQHLKAVMRKLAVHSRAALAQRLVEDTRRTSSG